MFAALLLSLALSQPTPPAGSCGPGKACKVSTLTATSGNILAMRNGTTSARLCLNSSSGANNAMFQWVSHAVYSGNLYLMHTPNPSPTACGADGTALLNFDANGLQWTTIPVLTHQSREQFQGTTIATLGTCSALPSYSINASSDAKTFQYCNLAQWQTLAVTGSAYTGSTVAAPHPTIPTGVDLQNTYSGPRRMEQCYVDPEGAVAPTCSGFITAPATVAGTGCAGNTADTGAAVVPMVKFDTDAVSGSYCSFSKAAGYITGAMWPRISFTWRPQTTTTTNVRYWIGWRSDTATLFGSDTPAGQWCAWRFSTAAGDTNWQTCSSDGSTVSCQDTGVAFGSPSSSQFYTMEVEPTSLGCAYRLFGRTFELLYGSIKSTNMPTSTAKGFPIIGVETLTNAARSFSLSKLVQEHQ